MAKRKIGVNNIIYELDNDDLDTSSDDEAKENRNKRIETKTIPELTTTPPIIDVNIEDVITVGSSLEDSPKSEFEHNSQNGGKNSPIFMLEENNKPTLNHDELDCIIVPSIESHQKNTVDGPETIILNEDIAVDSPASIGSGLSGEVGCENRMPLITVRFGNNNLANKYKEKIKIFLVDLLKLNHDGSVALDGDTDLDLEIWPYDSTEEQPKSPEVDVDDNLFFVDTNPKDDANHDIPKYTQGSTVISNLEEKEPDSAPVLRRGPVCFNCDGDHYLRDCQIPRNNVRIAEKRKTITSKLGRYHVEDDQKYGHLIPGRVSSQLRHALGLKRHELPLHIYRMRMLGYPPGWLEEARISHSGISMFDSAGNLILDDDEEEGQIMEVGSKDKFDIKKILDFPGFNVPASLRYIEEGNLLGMPPMSEQDSKLLMLQTLAPNAMKAYKRKKLTFFPSGTPNNSLQNSQTEMELDSGDEVTEFPSVPPLPDEAPPPPPPPPDSPPPPTQSSGFSSPSNTKSSQDELKKQDQDSSCEDVEIISVTKMTEIPQIDLYRRNKLKFPSAKQITQTEMNVDNEAEVTEIPTVSSLPNEVTPRLQSPEDFSCSKKKLNQYHVSSSDKTKDNKYISHEDVEVISVIKVTNMPVPEEDLIIIDEDFENISKNGSGRNSPTLDDLEKEKTQLLEARNKRTPSQVYSNNSPIEIDETVDDKQNKHTSEENIVKQIEDNASEPVSIPETSSAIVDQVSTDKSVCESVNSDFETSKAKPGAVKTTLYGTPVLNIASPYVKLPSDDKFAKDICDVINFENLPNSTGKYKSISSLLKKVKSEVDRIQES